MIAHLLLVLLGCVEARADHGLVEVVAHRGSIRLAPENTIPAFLKGIELGADRIEMDVRETRDGELVIMHDETVDRTTDGHGKVEDLTWAELQSLDAGAWFGPEWKGTRIPSFREALAAIRGRAIPDVDFKAGSIRQVEQELRAAGLLSQIPVTFYHWRWSVAAEAQQLNPGIQVRPEVWTGGILLDLLSWFLAPPLVNVRWAFFSEELISEIHRRRIKAFVEILGDREVLARTKRAVAAGTDMIQTDHPEIVVPYLRSLGLHP